MHVHGSWICVSLGIDVCRWLSGISKDIHRLCTKCRMRFRIMALPVDSGSWPTTSDDRNHGSQHLGHGALVHFGSRAYFQSLFKRVKEGIMSGKYEALCTATLHQSDCTTMFFRADAGNNKNRDFPDLPVSDPLNNLPTITIVDAHRAEGFTPGKEKMSCKVCQTDAVICLAFKINANDRLGHHYWKSIGVLIVWFSAPRTRMSGSREAGDLRGLRGLRGLKEFKLEGLVSEWM